MKLKSGSGPDQYEILASKSRMFDYDLTKLTGESLESLVQGFLSFNGPWDGDFDKVPPNTIFDREDDTLTMAWFVTLILTGKLESETFDCNGEKVTLVHPGYKYLLEKEYKEDIANPQTI